MDTPRVIRSPMPLEVTPRYLRLLAPSKSKPLNPRTIQYYPSGKHHCSCPGWNWFRLQGKHDHKCRHYKLTTTPSTNCDPLNSVLHALKVIKDAASRPFVSWGFVTCLFPQSRAVEGSVHCAACPLYPEYCNIHPIYFGKRNNQKPLVWRIQTAIYNGKRKEAARLLRKFAKIAKAIYHPDCWACHGSGYVGDNVECSVCHPNKR